MGKPYNYLGDQNAQIPVYGEGLSRNPYLPDAIAQKLIDSECTDCKEYAQVLTQVIFHHPHLLTHVLERYFSSSLLRMIILFHDKTSIACLEQASRSANWLERYLVAKHLNTPDSIREQLKRDDNPIVCESAKNAL